MSQTNRVDFDTLTPGAFWGDSIADQVLASNPDVDQYTCAAGISPSGVVHFGNFRDVITAYAVAQALRRKGKNSRIIFSWDNFDRLRKVPSGVPESFAQYIGMPLSKIPDPFGVETSYAAHFQKPFVEAMQELGVELEYLDQTVLYEQGIYDDKIILALQKRHEIAGVLLSMMTEKGKEAAGIDETAYREKYYPIAVYSRFTGKDSTEVLSYDGDRTITYRCLETKQEDTIDITKDHRVKLGWKIDWPMRWLHEGVTFEPGGHDHASPGGSFDSSSLIARAVYHREPPLFAEYKFVGIQGLGAKMSGSKGNAIAPADLLEIYDPVVLRWLYLRKSPQQSFMLAFDTEIYRQYDEFDREVAAVAAGTASALTADILASATGSLSSDQLENPIPFRQAVGFGQIVQWDAQKLVQLLEASGLSYSAASIESRLPRAKVWLTEYNAQEKFELLASVNSEYATSLDESVRSQIAALRVVLSAAAGQSVDELETLVYDIPKRDAPADAELKKRQRAFFGHVYNLLIGKDTGPRLSTFLWAMDRERVLALLNIE